MLLNFGPDVRDEVGVGLDADDAGDLGGHKARELVSRPGAELEDGAGALGDEGGDCGAVGFEVDEVVVWDWMVSERNGQGRSGKRRGRGVLG